MHRTAEHDRITALRRQIQQDIGGRGLARDPKDNLFTACAVDLGEAAQSLARHRRPVVGIITGFFVPNGQPPALETDGPLGAVLLMRVLAYLGIQAELFIDARGVQAIPSDLTQVHAITWEPSGTTIAEVGPDRGFAAYTHLIALECVGPAHGSDGYHNMRGQDITEHSLRWHLWFEQTACITIGIGDGGNEIGMGKIPRDLIAANIPKGAAIACRVPTDYLIVSGVSNWGAYGLAAAVAVERGVRLPGQWFDPDQERICLQTMVRRGPLIDGVTGKRTPTVDGLDWADYGRVLKEIGKLVAESSE